MKTYAQKPAEVTRVWYEVDASQIPVGRLATFVATLLTGKRKVTYTPHVDAGDYVVVINAAKTVLTGRKADESKYHYSGYPSGLKATTKGKLLADNPAKLVTLAVAGMVTTNKLKPARMQRLKVYAGPQHEHHAQQPQKVEVQ
jgi:large subunit ribosomal protein L13